MTFRTTAEPFVSPSLGVLDKEAGPAYELKFLLDEAPAREIEGWAKERLSLDPHGDPKLEGAYHTTTLYFDTPQLDVYHRTPTYKRRKFRVRRYGNGSLVFLERKTKTGDRVAKRRAAIPLEELPLLAHPISLLAWSGHWFHRRLLARRLAPACRIAYQRTAYFGVRAEGPLRLTLDRRIHGLVSSEWDLRPLVGGLALLNGHVILELKFRLALPALFKELVANWRLNPSGVSKYRLCREAWGASSPQREAADA